MTTDSEPKPTWRERLSKRLENPLAWDEPTKILIVLMPLVPLLIAFLIRAPQIIADPTVEPYISREALRQIIAVIRVFLGLTLVLVFVGLLLRRAGRDV